MNKPLLMLYAFTILGFVGALGWCMNLYKIATGFNLMDTAEAIVRCAGIFAAPLGAIMGYF